MTVAGPTFVIRWFLATPRNTYELIRQIPEYGGHVAAASILIDAPERRLRSVLLASVKSVFSTVSMWADYFGRTGKDVIELCVR